MSAAPPRSRRVPRAWSTLSCLAVLWLLHWPMGAHGVEPGPAPITPPAPAAAEEDPDALFLRALKLSAKETREQARALCRRILVRSPDYHDVRIHLGRLHAWDGQYDAGREAIGYVLARQPGNVEAREALADLEWWAGRSVEAVKVCDDGLALQPRSVGLLYRKARLLMSTGNVAGALEAALAALEVDPDHQPSRRLRDDLKELAQRSRVGVEVTLDTFDRTFGPWWLVSVSATHRFDPGTVIVRFNRADRFATSGYQLELDAYPRFRDGTYAYLNLGGSVDSVFPAFRAGAEFYQSLPAGFEASAGARYLEFSASEVTIWTGSVSAYHGDWLFTIRPSVTPGAAGSALSGSLLVRYYLDDGDSFLSATARTGVSPDQATPTAELLRIRAHQAGLAVRKRIGHALVLSGGASLERQEIRAGEWRLHGTFTLGCERRF
jgi:YaiO family outer membrane protein